MHTYRLKNGTIINGDRMVEEVLSGDEFPQLYFDTELGALIEIPSIESLGLWVSEIGNISRYLLIEPYDKMERTKMAHEFVAVIMPIDATSRIIEMAHKMIDEGSWDAFEDFLMESTDGWIDGWESYKNDIAWEYIHDWLTQNPHVEVRAEFHGCDDCALCDSLKDGVNPTVPELLKAFDTERVMQSVRSQLAQKSNTEVQKKIDPAFVDKAFVFKVTLKYSQPTIWRRIIIPATATFYELHCAIQDAMGWYDYHLHNFRISLQSSGKNSSRPRAELTHVITLPSLDLEVYEDDMKDIDERYETLSNWFGKKVQQCIYTYDFGDNWEHTVLLEKIISMGDGVTYPQCTAGKYKCPPEDCGSIVGYERIRKILANKGHEEHQDVLEWLGLDSAEEFDPTHFDPKEVIFEDPKECLQDWEQQFGF